MFECEVLNNHKASLKCNINQSYLLALSIFVLLFSRNPDVIGSLYVLFFRWT
uniref:Uncharacterized protein n=1 Tax=Anguilla anguilla TaxID=7936 RepID=A0A0E9RG93_ANGAN